MSVPSSAADRIEAESLGLGSYHNHPCRGRHLLPRGSLIHPRIFWEACTERSTRGVVLQGTFDSGRRKCRGDVEARVHLESPSFPLAGVHLSSPRLAYCVCTPHTRITKSSVGLNILPSPLLSALSPIEGLLFLALPEPKSRPCTITLFLQPLADKMDFGSCGCWCSGLVPLPFLLKITAMLL